MSGKATAAAARTAAEAAAQSSAPQTPGAGTPRDGSGPEGARQARRPGAAEGLKPGPAALPGEGPAPREPKRPQPDAPDAPPPQRGGPIAGPGDGRPGGRVAGPGEGTAAGPGDGTPGGKVVPQNAGKPGGKVDAPREGKAAGKGTGPSDEKPGQRAPAPGDEKPGERGPAPGDGKPGGKVDAPREGTPGGKAAGPGKAARPDTAPPRPARTKQAGAAPDAARAQPAAPPVPRPVAAAAAKPRHGLVLALFVAVVLLPVAGAAWYLYTRATDQYASTLGFSVRKEEAPSASELLGGIASLSGTSSSDTDVLNEFIQSQNMVERVDATLDLRAIYGFPENDPLFTLAPDATIEDLVDYWNRMITIRYDGGVGLIEVRVLAFRPEDAQAIARAIFEESTRMINDLTAIAREDATRFARQELEAALERLRVARAELTEFRSRTQIVDPNADIQGQMGLLNNLQAQLAEALIELDLLGETNRAGDPRVRQAEQRIAVIENRIAAERAKFGISDTARAGETYAALLGEYEGLAVNREFAERAYLTALTNFDAAQSEALRQSRYLAAHVQPTLAQSAGFPRRETILGVFALFATMAWATLALIYYSVRDRR